MDEAVAVSVYFTLSRSHSHTHTDTHADTHTDTQACTHKALLMIEFIFDF